MTATTEQWQWALGPDVGISSAVIWSVMTGERHRLTLCPSPPADFADFGRCYRLLERFPEWRTRLHEVAEAVPESWTTVVAVWPTLERLYRAGDRSGVRYLLDPATWTDVRRTLREAAKTARAMVRARRTGSEFAQAAEDCLLAQAEVAGVLLEMGMGDDDG